jgi:hypothetical protein
VNFGRRCNWTRSQVPAGGLSTIELDPAVTQALHTTAAYQQASAPHRLKWANVDHRQYRPSPLLVHSFCMQHQVIGYAPIAAKVNIGTHHFANLCSPSCCPRRASRGRSTARAGRPTRGSAHRRRRGPSPRRWGQHTPEITRDFHYPLLSGILAEAEVLLITARAERRSFGGDFSIG